MKEIGTGYFVLWLDFIIFSKIEWGKISKKIAKADRLAQRMQLVVFNYCYVCRRHSGRQNLLCVASHQSFQGNESENHFIDWKNHWNETLLRSEMPSTSEDLFELRIRHDLSHTHNFTVHGATLYSVFNCFGCLVLSILINDRIYFPNLIIPRLFIFISPFLSFLSPKDLFLSSLTNSNERSFEYLGAMTLLINFTKYLLL